MGGAHNKAGEKIDGRQNKIHRRKAEPPGVFTTRYQPETTTVKLLLEESGMLSGAQQNMWHNSWRSPSGLLSVGLV